MRTVKTLQTSASPSDAHSSVSDSRKLNFRARRSISASRIGDPLKTLPIELGDDENDLLVFAEKIARSGGRRVGGGGRQLGE